MFSSLGFYYVIKNKLYQYIAKGGDILKPLKAKTDYRTLIAFFLFAMIFISFSLATSFLLSSSLRNHRNTQATSAKDNESKTIVIDAGHGGEDPGTVGIGGVLEKDINLSISKKLSELFKTAGYNVIETRTEDILLYDRSTDFEGRKKVLDLKARLDIGKASGCDLFVSIHMNSFSVSKYSGLTVYYSKSCPISLGVAESVRDVIREKLQTQNNREIKAADSKIFLLDRADYPSILIECGFLSNPEECALLCDELYRQKLSLLIFSAIDSALD